MFDYQFRSWIKDNVSPNLTFLDLEDAAALRQRFSLICKQCAKDMGAKNEALFSSLLAGAYFFTDDKKHAASAEVAYGEGRIDRVFFPKGNVK